MGIDLNYYREQHDVENPPQWAQDRWEAYINADPPGSTVPESIGWPLSRFDQADLWGKYIDPLQRKVAELEARLEALEQ